MKILKLTEDAKKLAFERFQKMVENYTGGSDLSIKLTAETLLTDESIVKPIVFITADAYLQMMTLIQQCSKEVAWHGVVTKTEHNYLISKILVYPQTVTGATVDANEEEYGKWLNKLNNETINNLRFQGHSHVSMPVSPSGRDTENWKKFLNLLRDGQYYLFCIGNKNENFYWTIYDTAKNVMFENNDITMAVIDNAGNIIKDWGEENLNKYISENVQLKEGYTIGSYMSHLTNVTAKPSTTVLSGDGLHRGEFDMFGRRTGQTNVFSHIPKTQTAKEPCIPLELRAQGVDYDPETDMYYSDEPAVGFRFNKNWGCYIAYGETIREKYGLTKTGKVKKENKTSGKKKEPTKKKGS